MKKILGLIVLSLFLISNVYGATGWVKTKPAGSLNPGQIDDAVGENNAAIDLMLSNYQNCKLSYSSATTVSVSAGGVMVSDVSGATRLMLFNTSATSVTFTDIDTGAEAASTTYYIYAIASATTDTVFTCKISLSATAPTGATYYKRLGSFYNDASSNITQVVDDSQSTNVGYVKGQGNYYKISSGSASMGVGDTAISFDFTFSASPVILVSYGAGVASNWSYPLSVKSISTTGATVTQPNDGTATVYWYAIGQVLAQ